MLFDSSFLFDLPPLVRVDILLIELFEFFFDSCVTLLVWFKWPPPASLSFILDGLDGLVDLDLLFR